MRGDPERQRDGITGTMPPFTRLAEAQTVIGTERTPDSESALSIASQYRKDDPVSSEHEFAMLPRG